MKFRIALGTALLVCVLAPAQLCARGLEAKAQFQPVHPNLIASHVQYEGRAALRLTDVAGLTSGDRLLLLPARSFRDGVIEGEFEGRPLPGASKGPRGFVGIAFRVQQDRSRYEAFYIRPANGRSGDQLRRNRSTQYVSHPAFPWERLRREAPGKYESYADMSTGKFIRFRIEVVGSRARLFLNGESQPALIVGDLKLGPSASGDVALWIGPETEGYFADVTLTPHNQVLRRGKPQKAGPATSLKSTRQYALATANVRIGSIVLKKSDLAKGAVPVRSEVQGSSKLA